MSAPVVPAVSRQVFADLARFVAQLGDACISDDERQRHIQVTRLLHKVTNYAESLSGELASQAEEYARAWQELDHYAITAQQAREERDRLLVRVDELTAEVAELTGQP